FTQETMAISSCYHQTDPIVPCKSQEGVRGCIARRGDYVRYRLDVVAHQVMRDVRYTLSNNTAVFFLGNCDDEHILRLVQKWETGAKPVPQASTSSATVSRTFETSS